MQLTKIEVKKIAFMLRDCKTKNIAVLDSEQFPALENEDVRKTLLKVLKKKGYAAIDTTGQLTEYIASISVQIRWKRLVMPLSELDSYEIEKSKKELTMSIQDYYNAAKEFEHSAVKKETPSPLLTCDQAKKMIQTK